MFAGWKKYLAPDPGQSSQLGLKAVRLPGRESRLKEPARQELLSTANEIADAIAGSDLVTGPICLAGFSLGGWIAFEVARGLRARSVKIDLLVAGAARAPQGRWLRGRMNRLSDDRFLKKMNRKFGAIPAAVINNAEARSLLLPMLRGDNEMYETYDYRIGEPLDCEILTMGGTEDSRVKPKHIYPWREQTKRYRHRTVPGDHYFAKSQTELVVKTIQRRFDRAIKP